VHNRISPYDEYGAAVSREHQRGIRHHQGLRLNADQDPGCGPCSSEQAAFPVDDADHNLTCIRERIYARRHGSHSRRIGGGIAFLYYADRHAGPKPGDSIGRYGYVEIEGVDVYYLHQRSACIDPLSWLCSNGLDPSCQWRPHASPGQEGIGSLGGRFSLTGGGGGLLGLALRGDPVVEQSCLTLRLALGLRSGGLALARLGGELGYVKDHQLIAPLYSPSQLRQDRGDNPSGGGGEQGRAAGLGSEPAGDHELVPERVPDHGRGPHGNTGAAQRSRLSALRRRTATAEESRDGCAERKLHRWRPANASQSAKAV
jgi:hypothetical protein